MTTGYGGQMQNANCTDRPHRSKMKSEEITVSKGLETALCVTESTHSLGLGTA